MQLFKKNYFGFFLANFWKMGLLFIPKAGHTGLVCDVIQPTEPTNQQAKCNKLMSRD